MPRISNDPDTLRPFIFQGLHSLEWGNGDTEAVGDCPFCGREGKLSVNIETTKWRCLGCDESGNAQSFLTKVWEQSKDLEQDLSEVADNRGLLSPETLERWGICRSILTDDLLIPGFIEGGDTLGQLYRWVRDIGTGKTVLMASPKTNAAKEIHHQLLGMNLYDPSRKEVWIAEGWGDGVILWETLRFVKKDAAGELSQTPSEEESLLSSVNVLAVPGCNIWYEEWCDLFAGKKVVLLFDNDHPHKRCLPCHSSFSSLERETCPTCADMRNLKETPAAALTGLKRICSILSSSKHPPSEIQWLRWTNSTDPAVEVEQSLPHGYDVRDHLRKDEGTLQGRIDRLGDLINHFSGIPDAWTEGKTKKGKIAPRKKTEVVPCTDWDKLVNAWKKAIQLRKEIKEVLAVMLSVAISTEQVGDQLFLQVVGPPGSAKCLGKGTPVLMYDGKVKPVEEIIAGDLLMGPDSSPRTVLGTNSGSEMMYRIVPVKGDPYVVNESHILSFKRTGMNFDKSKGKTLADLRNWALKKQTVNISVESYLRQSDSFKHELKSWRTGVEWAEKDVPLDPYFLGLWLGDGDSRDQTITSADPEIIAWLRDYALRLGLTLSERKQEGGEVDTYRLNLAGRKHVPNPVRDTLCVLNVIHNKHVPDLYKTNSREVRLKVLAGLIDSDGSMNGQGYFFSSVLKVLTDDVAFLCRSLGLAAYVKPFQAACQTGVVGDYWGVSISGNCKIVPVILSRKKCFDRGQIKDVLRTGISVEKIGIGDYYGFTLTGDGLFLLGDFTVTHNTRLCDGMLTSKKCFLLEHLTGFHSGWKDASGDDYSLINRINGMTLITPEADVMMSSPHFQQIMSQQRRIFDGSSSASFKNRAEDMRYTGLRTPWIMAGTLALLDRDESRLGDRFLRVCISQPTEEEKKIILHRVGWSALHSITMTSNGEMGSTVEKEMAVAYGMTGGYVDYLRKNAKSLLSKVKMDEEWVVERCSTLAEFAADMRARPDPDKRKDSTPTKELPTRLTHQLVRLAVCLAVVTSKMEIDPSVLEIVKKVALDTSRGHTLEIATILAKTQREGLSVYSLAISTGQTEDKEKVWLRFLRGIGIVECYQRRALDGVQMRPRWRLTERFLDLYEKVMDN